MVSVAKLVGRLGTALGVAGYVVGTVVPYPGRAFSLTLAMVAITVFVIGDDWGGRS